MITTIQNKSVQKLISDLQSIGITFEFDQQEVDIIGVGGEILGKRRLQNVIFRRGNSELKIAEYLFFRHGGLCAIHDSTKSGKKGEENYVRKIPVTDDMFYSMERQSIERTLKIKTGEIKVKEEKK